MFSQVPSDETIGIIGSGQLGLMMVLEGIKFGMKFNILGNKGDFVCKFGKCFSNEDYKQFIDESTIITFEFEQGNENAMIAASDSKKLFPSYETVWLKIEKLREKSFLSSKGIAVPRFKLAGDGKEALKIVKDEFNGTAVIKKSAGGYDGKGQFYIKNNVYSEAIEKLRENLIVEEFINYDYESSVIITSDGYKTVSYPVSFNFNTDGILVYNYGPVENRREIDVAKKISEFLHYRGTMGVEFFVRKDEILVNEFSPRVHNSGHYTLNSSITSQFENHLRAISGIEIGSTLTNNFFGMVNILGKSYVPSDLCSLGNVHWYYKNNTNPRRKVGHINISGKAINEVKEKINVVIDRLYSNNFYFLKL